MLERCEADEKVINDFLDIVEIDNGIALESGDLESLDRLLLDVCRRYGFTRPFDRKGEKAYFRPNQIDHKHPDSDADVNGYWGVGEFDPKKEQAYRRGFEQGFADAMRLLEEGCDQQDLKTRSSDIHRWRFAPIWFSASMPGSVEPWGIQVSIRSKLPAKLRWKILERDGRRCVACGASADDGITLHVDHIVSVYNGGSDQSTNLQTLCDICNLGKGKD